jgi:hypothetical protein
VFVTSGFVDLDSDEDKGVDCYGKEAAKEHDVISPYRCFIGS